MYENMLPIGSVVLLKNANKRVMIVSRIVVAKGSTDIYDYCGCYYPEGIIDIDSLTFFNRDDIDTLYFVGFQDGEELQFRSQVLASVGELAVDENGRIVERAQKEEPAAEVAEPATEVVEPATEVVEPAVFADVD